MQEQSKQIKSVRYVFDNDEKIALSLELAEANREMVAIDENKRSIMSEIKNKKDVVTERINSLAGKISAGFEMREMECLVEFHKPKKMQKTVMVVDTGESFIEPMTNDDINLFNQYVADEQERKAEAEINAGSEVKGTLSGKPLFPDDLPENPGE